MIKWIAYIVLLLIFTPCLSSAKSKNIYFYPAFSKQQVRLSLKGTDTLTTKNNKKQEQEKIKEVTKAKKQPKPEKIGLTDNTAAKPKPKPKRQRRPEGLERPPEIPRRSGN